MSRKIIAELLEVVGEPVEVSAMERFLVRDKFVVDREGELPIRYIGEAFTEHFLGLIETAVKPAQLQQYRLIESSIDDRIFCALGGKAESRIALAHVFEFLKTADRSRWYFFYVTDAAGELWALDTYWHDRGWDMETYSVTYPRGWRAGGHVVSS